MEPFIYQNPTKLIFGRGQLSHLSNEIKPYGTKVLLVYGGGSIKRNGLYDQVQEQLAKIDATVFELSGVEPNPRLSTVQKGIDICKSEKIDFILAVGGGSVIDGTKAIAAGAIFDGNVWDIITKKTHATNALPFGTVLTLAATGSEMNSGSVITNWETQEKIGWGSPHVFPRFSILDPVHTFSVPQNQTVYGVVDIMSHVLEQYFSDSPNVPLNEGFSEAILRTVMEAAPKAIANPEDYEARESILYCGTMALNGTLSMGMIGDWGTHQIEHAVSAIYDIPHGGGLAIIFPNWIKYNLDATTPKMKQLAIRVFGVDPAKKSDREIALEGIEKLRSYWNSIGAPSRLADYKINEERLQDMAQKAAPNGTTGRFKPVTQQDVYEILKMCL
ncbi:iron-containing alcohol dehydrogenase [Shimazuella sp. AN120528]|uniref:iron-containing alcohol dehydrogenase n=1 Tax=Shimazuella soli TaxID=1892854 RepID=UPI001F0D8CA4|nr:iron-containing alcohol dehydrogenase [Shimazuella soli]MCH5585618.1 iron-containing alcohol dehydrogenase [Shimazuella soli]